MSRSATASSMRNYAGSEIKLDETEYLIVSEKDILAVVANGKK